MFVIISLNCVCLNEVYCLLFSSRRCCKIAYYKNLYHPEGFASIFLDLSHSVTSKFYFGGVCFWWKFRNTLFFFSPQSSLLNYVHETLFLFSYSLFPVQQSCFYSVQRGPQSSICSKSHFGYILGGCYKSFRFFRVGEIKPNILCLANIDHQP